MEDGVLKICLKDVISKKPQGAANKTELPDDFIEIIPKYIDIYHGCWIKYQNKESQETYPGGYLIDVSDDVVTLRNIRRDVFELPLYENYFYCKMDVPHHKAVKGIIEEKDKFSRRIEEFNMERRKFLETKKQFLNKMQI
jgi:hypothetical protein